MILVPEKTMDLIIETFKMKDFEKYKIYVSDYFLFIPDIFIGSFKNRKERNFLLIYTPDEDVLDDLREGGIRLFYKFIGEEIIKSYYSWLNMKVIKKGNKYWELKSIIEQQSEDLQIGVEAMMEERMNFPWTLMHYATEQFCYLSLFNLKKRNVLFQNKRVSKQLEHINITGQIEQRNTKTLVLNDNNIFRKKENLITLILDETDEDILILNVVQTGYSDFKRLLNETNFRIMQQGGTREQELITLFDDEFNTSISIKGDIELLISIGLFSSEEKMKVEDENNKREENENEEINFDFDEKDNDEQENNKDDWEGDLNEFD